MAYIITRLCRDCVDTGCVTVCPVDCVYEYTGSDRVQWPNQLYIHPDECIDCGACEPVCPTNAISDEVAVSENWKNYVELNAKYSKERPNIAAKRAPLPEADQWKDVEEKRQHLVLAPTAA